MWQRLGAPFSVLSLQHLLSMEALVWQDSASLCFRAFVVFEHMHIGLIPMVSQFAFETLVSRLSLCFVCQCSSMNDT